MLTSLLQGGECIQFLHSFQVLDWFPYASIYLVQYETWPRRLKTLGASSAQLGSRRVVVCDDGFLGFQALSFSMGKKQQK